MSVDNLCTVTARNHSHSASTLSYIVYSDNHTERVAKNKCSVVFSQFNLFYVVVVVAYFNSSNCINRLTFTCMPRFRHSSLLLAKLLNSYYVYSNTFLHDMCLFGIETKTQFFCFFCLSKKKKKKESERVWFSERLEGIWLMTQLVIGQI